MLVLGAGVSGLVVAYELGKLGYDYRILEARDRVGGLAWTVRRGTEHTEIGGERQVCTFDDGLYVNVGAWRIPYTHTGVLNYCRELGVPLEIFMNEAENAYFYYEGQDVGPLANTRVRLREVKADMIGYTNELLVKAIDQGQLDLPLTAEDKQRFVSYLVAQGYLDTSDRAVQGVRHSRAGQRRTTSPPCCGPVSASACARCLRRAGRRRRRCFSRSAGWTSFPRASSARSAPAASRSMPTCSRSTNRTPASRSSTSTRRTAGTARCSADFVVVCMPLSVLSGVDINLSAELMAAVKATTYSNSAKMGLAMKRRFWEEDDQIFGGHLYSNLPLGEFSYPSNDYFSQKGRAARALRQRAGGRSARSTGHRARRARADACEQGPSADPPGVRERVRGVVAQGEVQPGRLRVRRNGRRAARSSPGSTTGSSSARRPRRRSRPRTGWKVRSPPAGRR